MRIAYLSLDSGVPLFGLKGSSVHVRELANAMGARGSRVTVISARLGDGVVPLNARVVGVDQTDASHRPVLVANEAPASPDIPQPTQRHAGAAALLDELHRVETFDVIYERYSLWSAVGVRAAKRLGIPCLVEVNAPLVEEEKTYRSLLAPAEAKAIECEVFGGADALLAVSEGVRSYLLANGAAPARTFVIPNAVDPFRFHPGVLAERLDGADGRFVVGFVGSFRPWHGLDILLHAFRRLRQRSSRYHLLLVGEGPLRKWVESAVREFALGGAVTLTGTVAHKRVPSLIQGMDVTVAPYPPLNDFYFSPLKLFEYMAMGKPVVASRIGQIREVVQDGATGFLFEPGNPDALVEAIEHLREHPELRAAMGRAARTRVQTYTWEANAQRVMSIARLLLEGARK